MFASPFQSKGQGFLPPSGCLPYKENVIMFFSSFLEVAQTTLPRYLCSFENKSLVHHPPRVMNSLLVCNTNLILCPKDAHLMDTYHTTVTPCPKGFWFLENVIAVFCFVTSAVSVENNTLRSQMKAIFLCSLFDSTQHRTCFFYHLKDKLAALSIGNESRRCCHTCMALWNPSDSVHA